MKEFFKRYLGNERGSFILPALPWISAGFSLLQGLGTARQGLPGFRFEEPNAEAATPMQTYLRGVNFQPPGGFGIHRPSTGNLAGELVVNPALRFLGLALIHFKKNE